MSGKILLDTNIIIALFGQDEAVLNHLQGAAEVFVPVIAIDELYYGAYKSRWSSKNIQRVQEFTAANTVLACDGQTAVAYGRVKNELRQKGTPIPENDVWIAALALQYDLVLATRDKHFDAADGLRIEAW
ncbi:MAG: type II toxin-antitoxin system VapC family toxin [Chloroflexota bacterium]|nr:type II toxin-antitoxin system VapC family toxin [Chloroflexota bacterium]